MNTNCMICGKELQEAPTENGWFDIDVMGHTRGCHFACTDWLKETADIIRARIADAKTISFMEAQP